MYRTPAHLSAVLCRAGCPVSTRTLLSWAEKGLLPRLVEQGIGRAKGKVYYWPDRTIVHQAFLTSWLLGWRSRVENARLLLWLLGYNVSVEQYIQPLFMQILEGVEEYSVGDEIPPHEVSTHGDCAMAAEDNALAASEDDEELEDRLSALAVQNSHRWRHNPHKVANSTLLRDPQLDFEHYSSVTRRMGQLRERRSGQ